MFLVLFGSCTGSANSGHLNQLLFDKISAERNANSKAHITLANLTDFPWDKLYVCSEAAEDYQIRELIGEQYEFRSSPYSKKWIFELKGSIVYTEEKVIDEVDRPTDAGDVVFEIRDAAKKCSVFSDSAVFMADERRIDDGTYYFLTCSNCGD